VNLVKGERESPEPMRSTSKTFYITWARRVFPFFHPYLLRACSKLVALQGSSAKTIDVRLSL
jgi:hypothetical protein